MLTGNSEQGAAAQRSRAWPGTLTASAGLIMCLTLLARPFGIFKEILTARYFGTSADLDAFLLASSIPIFMCSILGGGMAQAVVPSLSAVAAESRERGWNLLTGLFYRITLFAVVFSALNYLAAPHVIGLLFPAQASDHALEIGIRAYRILSPALVGGMLTGLFTGASNTFHCYGATTMRAFAYNGSILAILILGHGRLGIHSLGWGILAAEFSQLIFVLPPLLKRGFRFQIRGLSARHGLALVMGTFLPAIVLSGMGQINYLVDRMLAMPLGEGCVSSLHYAWRMVLLPGTLVSVAFATPLLSHLSHHEAARDRREASRLMRDTARLLINMSIPLTMLMIVLSPSAVSLFNGWGKFSERGVFLTSVALFCYAPGLPFVIILPILVAGFMAVRKPWIPVLVSLPMIPLNWLLDRLLMGFLFHAGIAFSTSLVYGLNCFVLVVILNRHLPLWDQEKQGTPAGGRSLFFYMCVAILFAAVSAVHVRTGTRVHLRIEILLEIAIVSTMTLTGFLLLAYAFDMPFVKSLDHFLKRPAGKGD